MRWSQTAHEMVANGAWLAAAPRNSRSPHSIDAVASERRHFQLFPTPLCAVNRLRVVERKVLKMAAEGVGDGAMATVEYRIARGGHDEKAANGAWLAGAEIESSAARRQPLTFEVGGKMVLPVLDHAVRRLTIGAETGAPCTCAHVSDA